MNGPQQIAQLYYRYAMHIDKGEFEAVASLLSKATVFGPENIQLAKGAGEILEMYTNLIRIYPDTNTPKTQHLINNIVLEEITGDRAFTKANYTVMQAVNGDTIETIICGEYQGKFTCTKGEWEFTEHHMTPTIVGDMSQHLKVNVVSSNG